MDLAAEEAFRCVDVAYADYGLRVHDGGLDGDGFVTKGGVEMGGCECFFQRLGAEIF